MANEIKLSVSMQISGGNAGEYYYQTPPMNLSINASAAVANGHTPGRVLVPAANGVDIPLSGLVNPGGFAFIRNLSALYTVVIGIRDIDTGAFYPLNDYLPGEGWPQRLSQYLVDEIVGTGTNVTASDKTLHAKSLGGDSYIEVHAHDA